MVADVRLPVTIVANLRHGGHSFRKHLLSLRAVFRNIFAAVVGDFMFRRHGPCFPRIGGSNIVVVDGECSFR
jgi:hypothetical protein